MIIVPVRVVDRREDGLFCRLGSEPADDAPVWFLPAGCMSNLVVAEGSDLAVATIDPEKTPGEIRSALGLG